MSAALKLLASKPGDPVEPVTPAEPAKPVKTGAGITFLPLEDELEPQASPPSAFPDSGLFSGVAPDPSQEFAPEPEPEIPELPESETGRGRFRRLDLPTGSTESTIKYFDADTSTGEVGFKIVDEEEFIEFWSVDAYEMVSDLFALIRIDLSDIKTDEDELEAGRKAAKHLWKASGKYKWLAWMRGEAIVSGGDLFIAAAFFLGKGAMAARAVKKMRAKKPGKPVKRRRKPVTIEAEAQPA